MQAGLQKITLYENKGVVINYSLFSIATQGQVIELSTRPKLAIDPQAVNINYNITVQIDDLINDQIDQLNNSIYGWVAKFEFLDQQTKIIERPFIRMENSALNTNISNSRELKLESWNRQGLINFI